MMKLQTYAGVSFVGAAAIIYHAFTSRGQFYPATVYLSTSKISLVLLMNLSLVIMCIIWRMVKSLFLGSLREAEVETLNEQSWREVMETVFTITIFRQDFSVTFLVLVTTLLLIKALHWLAQKRVEYIETTPSVPKLSHIRIASFLLFLLVVDSLVFYSFLNYLIQTRRPSVALFFVFEYMILATTTVATFIKYIFYVSDLLMEGQWERKAVYTFYLELVRDLLHLSMYLCFFLLIFVYYGLPLNLIREIYWTFHNFKVRVADYLRYRKITSNMNERFPDATPEELEADMAVTKCNGCIKSVDTTDVFAHPETHARADATCIICREEMVKAKKLLCGHLFHVHCLRSWLERQHTCPTCRALVVPPENGTVQNGVRHGILPESNPQGSGSAGTSTQVPEGNDAVDDTMRHHQARLQAAAAAASMYEKSFVYPAGNTIVWTPGYALLPQVYLPAGHEGNANLNTEASTSRNCHHNGGESNPYNLNVAGSQVEAWERFIWHQIEVHQNQLQHHRQQAHRDSNMVIGEGAVPAAPDEKGKAADTGAASASTSNCGHQKEIEEAEKD